MLNSYAEKEMKSAIDDLVEYFITRVGGRRKQILTEAICNLITGIASHVEHDLVDSSDASDRMREFNAEFAKYWNAKVSERGLNNMIRIRDAQTEGKRRIPTNDNQNDDQ